MSLIHKHPHTRQYIKIKFWQKYKIDPLTFSLFHFSPLTFNFVISIF